MRKAGWIGLGLVLTLLAGGCKDCKPNTPGGAGKAEIRFTVVPAKGSVDPVQGEEQHYLTDHCKVAVYISVKGGWWNKPTWDDPLTEVDCGGNWSCKTATGGADAEAERFIAFLVPVGYDPPLLGGQAEIPAEVYKAALAYSEVTR